MARIFAPLHRLPPALSLLRTTCEADMRRRVTPAMAKKIIATHGAAPVLSLRKHSTVPSRALSTYARTIVPHSLQPKAAAPRGTASVPAPAAADHLLPPDLFIKDPSGAKCSVSLDSHKLLNTSSSYLIYSLMDCNTNGFVTPCELQSALGSLGLKLTTRQVDVLLERYDDAPRNGLFERNELIPLFDHLKLHFAVGSAAKVLRGVNAHEFFTKIGAVSSGRPLEAARAEHELLKNLQSSDPKYLSYMLFEKNSNGYITPEELQSGLLSLADIRLTDDELDQLVERYDDNRNGVLEPCEVIPLFEDLTKYGGSVSAVLKADTYELVFGATHEPSNTSGHAPWQVNHKLLSYSSKYLTHALLDADEFGTITYEELEAGLRALGVCMTPGQFELLVDRYDLDHNEVFDRDELEPLFDDLKVHALLCGYP